MSQKFEPKTVCIEKFHIRKLFFKVGKINSCDIWRKKLRKLTKNKQKCFESLEKTTTTLSHFYSCLTMLFSLVRKSPLPEQSFYFLNVLLGSAIKQIVWFQTRYIKVKVEDYLLFMFSLSKISWVISGKNTFVYIYFLFSI